LYFDASRLKQQMNSVYACLNWEFMRPYTNGLIALPKYMEI